MEIKQSNVLIKAESVRITKWDLRLSQTKRTLLCHVNIALSTKHCSDAGGCKSKQSFTYKMKC